MREVAVPVVLATAASMDAGNESPGMGLRRVANTTGIVTGHQAGYLMPLAAFILVAMALMAATLMRTTGQTGISVAQEAITLQAFYAAESGAQLGMSTLYFDSANPLDQVAIDDRCTGMSLTPAFTATGLSNCSAAVSCSRSSSGTASFYTITSVGNCGSGEVTSSRTVEVSAYFE